MQSFWGFDANLPMAIEPLFPEMGELSSGQSSPPQESNGKAYRCSDEDQESALMRDDLTAVYFDRVHPNIPFIHKLRYFDMLEQCAPSESQVCLQLAVQTAAAVSTAQTLKPSDTLYAEASAALENVKIDGPIGRARGAPVELEYIQAFLLIVYYEALRMPPHRYLLTAGRAFRLVQIARLHEVDLETGRETPSREECLLATESEEEAFCRKEAQRRTFWAAYCFDRFFSIRHELPITLHDVATHTRLPAPEASFQDTNPVSMPFLCDAISNPATTILPTFAESVMLATIQGRITMLRGASTSTGTGTSAPTTNCSNPIDIAPKLQDLRSFLRHRLQIINKYFPKASAAVESTLSCTHILAYYLKISLTEVAEDMVEHHQRSATTAITTTLCPAEAFDAYSEIVGLAKSSCRFSRFKTHLFLPVLLARAISFRVRHRPHEISVDVGKLDGISELMAILQGLGCVNRQAKELVDELKGVDLY
ncbi:fungal-specific transcription factor domain-containing protein [Aspergillus oleicola]